MNTTNVLNTEFIKRRRVELGLSVRQLSAAVGTSNNGLRSLEPDANQAEINIGLLDKLANALCCTIDDLIARPAPVDRAEAPEDPDDDDSAALGRILHTTRVLTPIPALAEITGWDHQRLEVAIDTLEQQLPHVGLVLHRLGDKVTIRASADVDGDQVAAALRSHINRDGLILSEIRLLRRILDGDCPTQPNNAEQVALGVLANARLIQPDGPGGWMPHPDVVFSVESGRLD
ncbi:MAG: helix-turn-helix domain-containing protein [Acidimicrobiales bacterium]